MGRDQSQKLKADPPPAPPPLLVVSFEKYRKGEFCLSDCERPAVKGFADCLRMLCSLTYQQLLLQSSKGPGKRGLNPTLYDDGDLKGARRPAHVPSHHRICGVRAGDDDRLFGYFVGSVFYVLWFDSHHEIVPV